MIYFLFGAAGTAGRVALSPTLEFGLNTRTVVEVITGGVAGFVLPYFGGLAAPMVGLDAATFAATPMIIKAGIVFLLSGMASLVSGDILSRLRGGKP